MSILNKFWLLATYLPSSMSDFSYWWVAKILTSHKSTWTGLRTLCCDPHCTTFLTIEGMVKVESGWQISRTLWYQDPYTIWHLPRACMQSPHCFKPESLQIPHGIVALTHLAVISSFLILPFASQIDQNPAPGERIIDDMASHIPLALSLLSTMASQYTSGAQKPAAPALPQISAPPVAAAPPPSNAPPSTGPLNIPGTLPLNAPTSNTPSTLSLSPPTNNKSALCDVSIRLWRVITMLRANPVLSGSTETLWWQ